MNSYSIALYLHIVGALAFFVTLGLEWITLRHLQRATTTEQVREWIRVPYEMGRAGMIAMLMLLGAGLYMMATTWGGAAWILITLAALALMIPFGMVVTQRRMAAIEQAANVERRPLSSELLHLLHDPLLSISIQTRIAIALGIVFLMTIKPDAIGSLLTIGIATVLGLASSLPALRRDHTGRASQVT